MYGKATGVLKVESVYKQGRNYHPQVWVEGSKYIDAKSQKCKMLSDSDDDQGLFEV